MKRPEKLRKIDSYFYTSGIAGSSMLYNIFTTYVQFFYSDTIKLSAELVGRGWFLFGIWNTFNDPISGRLSDYVKSKLGKREKLIKILILPVVLTFIFIWIPRLSSNDSITFFYYLLIISAFDIFHSMIDVNLNSILPEMFVNIKERANVAKIIGISILLAAGVAITIIPGVYPKIGWFPTAAIFGTVALITYTTSLVGIKEKVNTSKQIRKSIFATLGQLATRGYFLNLIGLQFFLRIVLAVIFSSLSFYAKYVLELTGSQTVLLFGMVAGASIISLPFWEKLTVNKGTRTAMLTSLALTLTVIWVIFPDYNNIYLTMLAIAFVSSCFSGTQTIVNVMSTEIVDLDYSNDQEGRTGFIYGLLNMSVRFPPAITGLLLGEVLALAQYDAELTVAQQPSNVALYLKLFLIFGIAIGGSIALLFAYFYPKNTKTKLFV